MFTRHCKDLITEVVRYLEGWGPGVVTIKTCERNKISTIPKKLSS